MDCQPSFGPQHVAVHFSSMMSSKGNSLWNSQCIIRRLCSQCHCCPLSHPQSPVLWGISLWSFFPSVLQGWRVWRLDCLPRWTHWLTGKLMQRWLLVHCNCVYNKKNIFSSWVSYLTFIKVKVCVTKTEDTNPLWLLAGSAQLLWSSLPCCPSWSGRHGWYQYTSSDQTGSGDRAWTNT